MFQREVEDFASRAFDKKPPTGPVGNPIAIFVAQVRFYCRKSTASEVALKIQRVV